MTMTLHMALDGAWKLPDDTFLGAIKYQRNDPVLWYTHDWKQADGGWTITLLDATTGRELARQTDVTPAQRAGHEGGRLAPYEPLMEQALVERWWEVAP